MSRQLKRGRAKREQVFSTKGVMLHILKTIKCVIKSNGQ